MRELVVTALATLPPELPAAVIDRIEVTADARPRAWRHGQQRGAGRGQGGPHGARQNWRRRSRRKLVADSAVAQAEAAGPGFLNLTLAPAICCAPRFR